MYSMMCAVIAVLSLVLVEHVCMEATGVYWVALYDYLDNAGFDVTLFNGAYARNLPGRKTDVKDCQWHGRLHSHGLLKGSFIPDDMIRQLRGAVRDREVAYHCAPGNGEERIHFFKIK